MAKVMIAQMPTILEEKKGDMGINAQLFLNASGKFGIRIYDAGENYHCAIYHEEEMARKKFKEFN